MSANTPSNWRKAAFSEYTERRKLKLEEIAKARNAAERADLLAKTRETELAELDKAARVLGVVAEPLERPAEAADGSKEPTTTKVAGQPLFKDLALEALRAAYPRPMRAPEVQKSVEKRALQKFHFKTAGMTLFRLSKKGIVRRDGWYWYFVPEGERPAGDSARTDGSDDAAPQNEGEGPSMHH